MTDLLGLYVGRYHIVERLGAGGMATVYRAYDARLERDVAIKFIRTDVVRDEMFLKRFEREAKALARLSHPNIVKVLDYGDHQGMPYLVMEFIRGDTLKSLVGKPIAWRDAARMLVPIADALDYTHKQNIIHRDVKPSNFLMSDSGYLMLSDFGIAKIIDRPDAAQLTGTGVGIGTPEYMAPEQGLGQTVDQRADVYSLGIVFYEMVTGHKPYQADTPMAVMYKQISDPLPSPRLFVPDLPDHVERVLFKALAKKAQDRYQHMAEFSHALQELVGSAQTAVFTPASTMQAQTAARPITQPGARAAQPIAPPKATQIPLSPPKKKSARLWIGCSVAALVVICGVVLALTGGFGALIAFFGIEPAGLQAEVSAPATVNMGEKFDVVVALSNTGTKSFTVNEVQLPKALLDVATVASVNPAASDTLDYGESVGYFLDVPLAPGERKEVRFVFEPLSIADVTGKWDIKVGTRSKGIDLRVVILEAVQAQLPTSTVEPTLIPTQTETPTQTEIPTPISTPKDTVLVQDDFSDPASGWYVGTIEDRAFEYLNGEYFIEAIQSSWLVWVVWGGTVSGVEISVDARVDRPIGNTGYGILCRYQNEGDFYGLEVSEDGYYTIWRRQADAYITLVDWQYAASLAEKRPHRLTATCIGDTITLAVDGVVLAQAQDSALTTGDFGLMVESYDTGGTRVAFDNLLATEK